MSAEPERKHTSPASQPTLSATADRMTRRWALGLAWTAATVALAVLTSWWSGRWSALRFAPEHVPMAPASAVLVFVLAAAITLRARTGRGNPTPTIAVALAIVGLVASGIIVGAALLDIPLGVEAWMSRTDERVGGILVGRVSRFTAALILLLSLGLLRKYVWAGGRNEGVAIAMGVGGVCFVIVQGYLLGGPLFYEAGTIPVAAATAFSLLLLGAALLITSGADRWPVRMFLPDAPPSERVSPWAFRMLTIVIALVVVSSGYLWHQGERRREGSRARATLTALADLKADQLSAWRAAYVAAAPTVPPSRAPLDGTEPAAFPLASGGSLPAVSLEFLIWRIQGDSAVAFDDTGARASSLALPLDPTSRLSGVQALLVVRPRNLLEFVRRCIRSGGVAPPCNSAAIPRRRALPERRSGTLGSSTDFGDGPLGDLEATEGIDHRDTEVLSVARPIAGTPWTLVAKVDRSELLAPIVRSALGTTIISLLLILGLATATYALWSRRELRLVEARNAAGKALEDSEARYARAVRATIDGLWDWDLATGALYLSPSWKAMLGFDPTAPIDVNEAFFSRLHPEDRPRVEAALEAHFEERTQYELEFRVRDGSGTYRWLWAKGEAEFDALGRPKRMVGGISDISSRKAAEEALLRADRILRVRSACNLALVHTASEEALLQAVAEVTVREGGYRMAWVGYAEHDEARSVRPVAASGEEHGYLDRVHVSWSAHDEHGQGPTGRCIRTGTPQAAQDIASEEGFRLWRGPALDRGFRSSCAIPLRVDGGTIGALMLYSSEVGAFDTEEMSLLTELGHDLSFGIRAKRDARAVADQQAELALFRQAMERSSDAIFVADAESGRFVDFNETAARQLGYTAEEMRDLGPGDVAPHLASPGAWQATVARVRRHDAPVRRSVHRRKDGTDLQVEISYSLIEDRDRTLVLGIVRDVSEREAAEREREALRLQLEQAQKMESVGRLAGGVAHDFNNLLTVVNATADLALADMAPDGPLREDLEQIRAAGDRAATLTRQLLAFSRQQVMHRRPVALNEVITDFLGMIQRVIGEHIHVETKLASELDMLHADPGQLEQVLMNLCLNARDAMPRGGTVTIDTRNVMVDEEHAASHIAMRPGPHVLMSVSDTGDGMDEETRSRIFDPFFTTKGQGKGTGLGLSTVYGIVKQSGGSIWVYSEIGLGTTFKLYFPIAEPGGSTTERSSFTPAGAGSERILVVDDEDAIRHLVRRLLTNAGYEVVEASSGREAVARVRDEEAPPIDLVLTDLVMPEMSGTQLAAELDREHPGVKILLATGYSTEAVAGRLPAGRPWNLIGKPYSIDHLLREVRRILDE